MCARQHKVAEVASYRPREDTDGVRRPPFLREVGAPRQYPPFLREVGAPPQYPPFLREVGAPRR